jgi:hypothetical protein
MLRLLPFILPLFFITCAKNIPHDFPAQPAERAFISRTSSTPSTSMIPSMIPSLNPDTLVLRGYAETPLFYPGPILTSFDSFLA